jgi:hypothetical protein
MNFIGTFADGPAGRGAIFSDKIKLAKLAIQGPILL